MLSQLLRLSVRKRILGGFAVVLLLLAALAAVALRGMDAVSAGAARVSLDSAQATSSAELALLVGEARTRVLQYALTASMDDQKAAQAALAELGQSIDRSHASDGELAALATRYRAEVDASIATVEARRSGIELMQAAATELRTIVSATTQVLDRDADPGLMVAAMRETEAFGMTDGAAARFVAMRTPAEANAAATAVQALRAAVAALEGASTGNRRIQRFLKGMTEPLDRFSAQLQRVVAADEQLRLTTEARDRASAAVLEAAARQRTLASDSQSAAVAAMLAGTGSARSLSLVTAASAIALGLLLAWLIGGNIARPIMALTAVMHDLAEGSLEVVIPNAGRRDELGEMARAVVVFKEHAQAVLRLRAQQEADHQAAEAEKRAAITRMAETIEDHTRAALEEIGGTTGVMASTADEMAASSVLTGTAAEEAATSAGLALANAQTVAASAEELASSIREIGSQVSHSAAVVDRAVGAGTDARATIESLNSEVMRSARWCA